MEVKKMADPKYLKTKELLAKLAEIENVALKLKEHIEADEKMW